MPYVLQGLINPFTSTFTVFIRSIYQKILVPGRIKKNYLTLTKLILHYLSWYYYFCIWLYWQKRLEGGRVSICIPAPKLYLKLLTLGRGYRGKKKLS